MSEALGGLGTKVDTDLDASGLLALARARKTAEDQAAAVLLDVAARWADLHPPESIHHAATFSSGRGVRNPVGCTLSTSECRSQ